MSFDIGVDDESTLNVNVAIL